MEITAEKLIKFLGIESDCKLNFEKHISYLCKTPIIN